MISPAAHGFGHVLEGFRLIVRPGVRRYVLIPLLINILLFGGVIYWGWNELDRAQSWLDDRLPGWLEWLHMLVWPLFLLTALVVVFYLFTPLANLIGAPFNAFLAERIERDLGGDLSDAPAGGLGIFVREALRALWGELRKLVYMVLWSVPLLTLFVIPGVNLAAPVLWTLFGAWMLAIEYVDYPMGNHGMTFPQERALLRRNRPLALGFGGGILLLTMVPFVNFLAMPVGVAGATSLWVRHLRRRSADGLPDR